jgi:hypothetical protein
VGKSNAGQRFNVVHPVAPQGAIFATHPSLDPLSERENAPAVVGKLVDVVDPPT